MNDDKCPTCHDYVRDCLCCLECGAPYGDCDCGAEEEDEEAAN